MSRQTVLLSALGGVLLIVVAWFLLFSPQNSRIEELEAETVAQNDQAALLRAQIDALELVRANAPEIEADIARLEAIVPFDTALPSALRQLQAAADDAGVAFTIVTPTRPQAVPAELAAIVPGLHELQLQMAVTGSYFQTVDFLRRLEDPSITSRGILIDRFDAVLGSEYPTLNVSVIARMFAVLDEVPLPVAEQPAPPPTDEPADGEATADDEEAES